MFPTGNVTFLFTDIEGSTKLAHDYPEILNDFLHYHNAILREAVESNNGFVFKIVGDAFCCSFNSAGDAVKASKDIQISLLKDSNNELIKVRIGIHSGKAEWNGEDYMGYITLARTQRIMSTAHGGQIIISVDAFESFVNDNLTEFSFRDLGERRLKDMIQPLRLFQINSEGLTSDFPPLKTLDARPNNLPVQLTSFIGREKEIADVKSLLNKTRLLTLLGPGGTGKTRLSLQTGADLIDDFANGVWITELASLLDPFLLPNVIAETLGISEQPGKSMENVLIEYLSDKEILLIIDNCEHLIDACAALAEKLLQYSPKLKIIATSRESLRCDGEITHKVLSLDHPDLMKKVTPIQLVQYEAVRLFIERALAVNPNFRVTNDNAPALAQICYQLDGIPLAIELAAVRIKVLPLEKICEKLEDRFKLLTGGKRTALPRQQTLKALIDWSFDLLSENEKNLWKRLSVFSGGWTFDAAEEICRDDKIDNEVIDILSSLTEKSIINYNEENERFGMLQTIRQYGEDKIRETNEYNKFSDKHLKFYLELTVSLNKKIRGIKTESFLKSLENEIGNVERSLKWSIENQDIENGLRLTAAMAMFWQIRGYTSEAIYWIEAVLHNNTESKNSSYSNVICHLGNFARLKGEVDKARKLIEESLQIRKEIGDKAGISNSLIRLGVLEYDQGRYEQSADLYEQGLIILRELGDKSGIAVILNNLGNVYSNQGDYSRAYDLYEESLSTRRESGDKLGIAICLNNLGIINYEQGEYKKATEILQESLQLRQQMGSKDGTAITLLNLGNVAYNQGEYGNATKLFNESLNISLEIGNKGCISDSLYNLGKVFLEQKDFEQASKLFLESLEISREIKAKSQIASSLYGLGRIAFGKNEYEEAVKYYLESIALYNEAGNKKDILFSIFRSGEIYVRKGNYEAGAKLFGFISRKYFELSKIKFPLAYQVVFDDSISEIKSKLNSEEFLRYFEEGKKLTLEEVCQLIVDSNL
ncbi:MAG: tetratricopeptide repeat protein [Ignavibacteria bacterium]|nr:tetratricopeptide repeat protein [Ignavibacteria bacterium]